MFFILLAKIGVKPKIVLVERGRGHGETASAMVSLTTSKRRGYKEGVAFAYKNTNFQNS